MTRTAWKRVGLAPEAQSSVVRRNRLLRLTIMSPVAASRIVSLLLFSGMIVLACGEAPTDEEVSTSWPFVGFSEYARIGGADAVGAAAFGNVRSVALLDQGVKLAVADGQVQRIHVFKVDGTFVRTIGREGWGPGEFKAIRNVWQDPSRDLCVWDVQMPRVTRFDSIGNLLETTSIDLGEIATIRPSFVGPMDDCRLVLRDRRLARSSRRKQESLVQDTIQYLLFGGNGKPIRTLAVEPEVSTWWRRFPDGNGREFPYIFGANVWGAMVGEELWVGVSDSLKWTRFDLEGNGLGVVRYPWRARPVTEHDVAEERERRLDSLPYPTMLGGPVVEKIESYHREGTAQAPARSTLPAYDAMVPGHDGSLWIRQYPLPSADTADWLLIRDGRIEGRLPRSPDSRLMAASGALAVFLERDEYDASVLTIMVREGFLPEA